MRKDSLHNKGGNHEAYELEFLATFLAEHRVDFIDPLDQIAPTVLHTRYGMAFGYVDTELNPFTPTSDRVGVISIRDGLVLVGLGNEPREFCYKVLNLEDNT